MAPAIATAIKNLRISLLPPDEAPSVTQAALRRHYR